MGQGLSVLDQATVGELRRRRAELRESMGALESALAGPAPIGQARWSQRVHVALVELSADFREHITMTEGPEGVYVDILATAPRLSGHVDRLTREHARVNNLLEDLLEQTAAQESPDIDGVRARGTTLLGLLVGHRQRGSDLLYEAYQLDVGGGD